MVDAVEDTAPDSAPDAAMDAVPDPAQDAGVAGAELALDAPAARVPFAWPDPLPAASPEVAAARRAVVIGTWTPADPARFDEAWVDEVGLREVFTGRRHSRRVWQGISGATDVLPLDTLLSGREGPAVAYAYLLSTRIPRDEHPLADAPAILHARHRGRIQVRVDGALVLDALPPAPGTWGEARAPIVLTDTYDVVLVKVGRGLVAEDAFALELRLSDAAGAPIPFQDWRVVRSPDYPSDLDTAGGGAR